MKTRMPVSSNVEQKGFSFRKAVLTKSADNTAAPANDTSGDEDDTEESEEE